ncbi:hypothetical protein N7468_005536 [Penicillium chermesinum]|uniref:Uncharacterized protein n=1 Tax=Penicillium chermesinum TaxID=63820 RepID=A0A9W9NZL1_9EURO|nr:uncharacterized protein N7468_005536 [Penicillium chermesinum]KAJ5232580.1 hypothetical protein N7468_005536 [Penicillium chermesinum]
MGLDLQMLFSSSCSIKASLVRASPLIRLLSFVAYAVPLPDGTVHTSRHATPKLRSLCPTPFPSEIVWQGSSPAGRLFRLMRIQYFVSPLAAPGDHSSAEAQLADSMGSNCC